MSLMEVFDLFDSGFDPFLLTYSQIRIKALHYLH